MYNLHLPTPPATMAVVFVDAADASLEEALAPALVAGPLVSAVEAPLEVLGTAPAGKGEPVGWATAMDVMGANPLMGNGPVSDRGSPLGAIVGAVVSRVTKSAVELASGLSRKMP